MKVWLTAAAGLMLSMITTLAPANDNNIRIHNSWIRAAPPGAKMLAAYMKIVNLGDHPQILTGAGSPQFSRVEMHNTILENGLARMKEQKNVEISARSSFDFKPGGYHFMLIGGKAPLEIGDMIDLRLTSRNGEEILSHAVVRKATEAGGDHSGHEMHQH